MTTQSPTIPYTPIPRREIEDSAANQLKRLDLYSIPVNPVTVAKRLNIEVFTGFLESISGILTIDPDDPGSESFQITVNKNDSPWMKRYALAHEIGHYCLHRDISHTFIDPEINLYRSNESAASEQGRLAIEAQANMFAAALLMPEEHLIRDAKSKMSLNELADKYHVSKAAMGYRLVTLGLV